MIDWARVAELYEQVGPEAMPEVLSLFESEVVEGLKRLAQAREHKIIAAEFHFIKGAALNLGMNDIARSCGIGESRALREEDASAQVQQIQDEFPRVCDQLMRDWRGQVGE